MQWCSLLCRSLQRVSFSPPTPLLRRQAHHQLLTGNRSESRWVTTVREGERDERFPRQQGRRGGSPYDETNEEERCRANRPKTGGWFVREGTLKVTGLTLVSWQISGKNSFIKKENLKNLKCKSIFRLTRSSFCWGCETFWIFCTLKHTLHPERGLKISWDAHLSSNRS